MRFTLISFVVLMLLATSCHQSAQDFTEIKNLSGTWKFQLDPDNLGIKDKWFNKELSDSVKLPGTTDENKKGIFIDEKAVDRLSRVWYWKGAAWYQKEVDIPENWEGKNVRLLLERTKDTYVWFDDINCGYENTLSAPQYFDLSPAIKPGKHKITVLVNNAILPPVGPSHAVDERTQTNWNGIIGKIELQKTDPVWIDEVQVYPDIKNNRAKVHVKIRNNTGAIVQGNLTCFAESWNTNEESQFKSGKQNIRCEGDEVDVDFYYDFNKKAPLWDEFDPALIKMNMKLSTEAGENKYSSSKQIDFGMREFKREGKYLLNNGERIYLRGRLDCANYPITGYPPMNRADWLKYFRLLKTYGINHWRFHSWCPPEEALMAADIVGVYLQPELPNKRSGMDRKSMKEEEVRKIYNADYLEIDHGIVNLNLKDYLEREGELVFKHFGNHPSFVMFTLGNELGRNKAMYELVAHFQNIDPRRLYAQGSNNMSWDISFAEGDDFWVTAYIPGEVKEVRGSYAAVSVTKGINKPHIEYGPPSTMHTFSKAIENIDVPLIGHETGQFQVSPDFNDIPKFTGVTRARNYEIFRERLKEANMLDQADDFVKASGKLAVICYREDIEAALRTPDFGGFQLLDIQDFPGQGTALIGILNDFMESKGLITPENWSEFCSEVVPLLKMPKFTWTSNEDFKGELQIAHYGKDDFSKSKISWKLINQNGEIYSSGQFENLDIERGKLSIIGDISCPLNQSNIAEKLTIEISLEGTKYKNGYDIWVYPEKVDISIPDGILISDKLDQYTKDYLLNGGRAIIFPDHEKLDNCIGGAFQTDFWCYPMFAKAAKNNGVDPAPGSLGFICDPESPLLDNFPTEFHSNWQWWHLVKNCKPIILDETPAEYKPLIQTIDNFDRNHKLGMIFESKYGEGSMLVCAIDLLNLLDKPEARQLYNSILKYVESDNFSPHFELDKKVVNHLFD